MMAAMRSWRLKGLAAEVVVSVAASVATARTTNARRDAGAAPGEGGAAGHRGGPARAGDGKSGGGRGATQAARAVAHHHAGGNHRGHGDGAVEAMRDACGGSSTAACATRATVGASRANPSANLRLTRRRAGLDSRHAAFRIFSPRCARFQHGRPVLRRLRCRPPHRGPVRAARWSPPMSAPSAASALTCPRTSTARRWRRRRSHRPEQVRVPKRRHLGPLRLDPPPPNALSHRRSHSQG